MHLIPISSEMLYCHSIQQIEKPGIQTHRIDSSKPIICGFPLVSGASRVPTKCRTITPCEFPNYPFESVFARGLKVIFDQFGPARSLPRQPVLPADPPSAAAFDQVVSAFLVESLTTAKLIARGDFWRAHYWFAQDLRPQLLQLIEWHSHGHDTWYNGRFINSWADPRVSLLLPQTFALYERQSLSRALNSMVELVRLLGEETAAHFYFSYPAAAHDNIMNQIDDILRTT